MTLLEGIAPRTQPIPTLIETAGHAIVRTLEEHGISRAYVVPAESYLDVLDGLYDSAIEGDANVGGRSGRHSA